MNVNIKIDGTKYVVIVPKEIANSLNSFKRILYIFDNLRYLKNKKVIFDFSNTIWFDANLCSIFGALFIILIQNNNSVKIRNLSGKTRHILERNKFLSTFGLTSRPDVHNTTIDFKIFSQDNRIEFQEYVDKTLIPKLKIDMSEDFKSIFSSNLDEIYQNARTHGDSSKILACGQWFPNLRIVKFTICDIGLTIPENIKNIDPSLSDSDCIDYSTEYGTSTKPSNESGGLGLYNLKSFIEYNKGKMHIISGNGYWGKADDTIMDELDSHFNGTIVNLEINLNDDNIYYCMNELGHLNNIEKDRVIGDLF